MDLKARGLASAWTSGERLFHWTDIRGMKLRIQYVAVVALMRGRTKKRAWARVLALAGWCAWRAEGPQGLGSGLVHDPVHCA